MGMREIKITMTEYQVNVIGCVYSSTEADPYENEIESRCL